MGLPSDIPDLDNSDSNAEDDLTFKPPRWKPSDASMLLGMFVLQTAYMATKLQT